MLKSLLRGVAVSVIGPVTTSLRTGYWRSAIAGRPVDRRGQPVPWLTYPAINFLASLDLKSARVLEYGAGNSTLWFAERCRSVVSYEDHPEWARIVRQKLNGRSNVTVIESALVPPAPDGVFDLALIDGLHRAEAAALARGAVAPDGLIVFDNSEGDWGDALSHLAGFMRVDFWGLSPSNWRQHCTSIFFRENCRFLRNQGSPTLHG
jgi:hypothetical protein